MNKKRNILIILIVLMFILFIMSSYVLAFDIVNQFENSIETQGLGTYDLEKESGKIVGVIQVIGTMVAVGMLIVLGVKYMMGSADQKAEYRKSMTPYIVGSVLIFGFSNLTQIIYEWARKI